MLLTLPPWGRAGPRINPPEETPPLAPSVAGQVSSSLGGTTRGQYSSTQGRRCEGRRIKGLGLQAEVKAGTTHPPHPNSSKATPLTHNTYKVTIPPQLPHGKRPWPWNHGGFAVVATRCLSRGTWVSRNHSDPGEGREKTKSASHLQVPATHPCRMRVLRRTGHQSHHGRDCFLFYCDSGKGL